MISTPNKPAWHLAAKLRLTKIQAAGEAASATAKAFEAEGHTHNAAVIDLRKLLSKAEEAMAVIKQVRIPDSDNRAVAAKKAADQLRAEIAATATALNDAQLRYAAARELSNARLRLAYDAKQALRACQVPGVN